MGYVIGISAYYHESSLSLFKDGKLVFFSREEYFSRIKADISFPRLCLQHCIKEFGIQYSNIDRVVFYEKPLRSFLFSSKIALKYFPASFWLLINNLMKIRRSGLFFYSDLNKIITIPSKKISYCPHHLSHVYSTFPFVETENDYISLVVDGFGDIFSTSAYIVKNKEPELIFSQNYPNSIGLVYSAITEYLGFRLNDGEFKVMALAAFGDGSLDNDFLNLCKGKEPGSVNQKIFKFYKSISNHLEKNFFDIFGPEKDKISSFPKEGSLEFKRFANIAHAVQSFAETEVKLIIDKLIDQYKIKKFHLSGGVALNSKLISSLEKIKNIEQVFVPANPGDSGASIGAGVFGCLIEQQRIEAFVSPFLGPSYDKNLNLIKTFCTPLGNKATANKLAAELISNGNVISVFNSKVEVGPRALGNRSIVCDPRNSEITKFVSTKMKRREIFQPLAPAILEEDFDNWFIVSSNIKRNLYWMGALAQARKNTKEILQPVCHVDGTARVQIVKKDQSEFYDLISEFKKISKVPVIVNTSLNCGGDPIVLDTHDLISTIIRMGIKYTLFNGTLWRLNEEHLI